MSPSHKPCVWLCDHPLSPPLSECAQDEAGWFIRQLQAGQKPPESKKVKNTDFCRLRFEDSDTATSWRIFYRVDNDAIVIIEICTKKSQAIPKAVMTRCKSRLKEYDKEKV